MKHRIKRTRKQGREQSAPARCDGDLQDGQQVGGSAAGFAHAAEEWRTTVDAMRDAVALLDSHGCILRCNRAMQEFVDLAFDEIIGRSCWELVYGQRSPPEECDFSAGDWKAGRVVTRRVGGRWFAITIEPVRDNADALTGAVHVMVDMSEIKQAEADLKRYSAHMSMLRDIDLAILELHPPSDVARDTLDRLRNTMSLCAASVTIFDSDCREVTIVAVIDDGGILPTDARVPASQAWIKSLRGNKACAVPDPRILLPKEKWGARFEDAGVASSHSLPLLTTHGLIGALNLGFPHDANLSAIQYAMLSQIALSLAVALQNARLFESVNEKGERLRELSTRLTNVEEAWRLRLARELHDRVGQTLTALGINLNHARTVLAKKSPEAIKRLDEGILQVEEISERIRDVMSELRPPALDDYGLAAALHCYSQQFAQRTGMDIAVVESAGPARLPGEVEITLFRIAQEALTNISKHARATHVRITVDITPATAVLAIRDNGVGFKAGSAASQPRSKSTGWGMLTMKERAEGIDGTFSVASRIGKGTTVTISVRRT